MEQKEGIQALIDGRKFKDNAGNVYLWSDDNLYKSPFRVNVKDEVDMIPGLHNFWDVLDELVEIFEFPDLAIDTKVLVSDGCDRSDQWLSRHFKGWTNNGFITAFDGGQTSHTANPESTGTNWNYWKVAGGIHKGKANFPQF